MKVSRRSSILFFAVVMILFAIRLMVATPKVEQFVQTLISPLSGLIEDISLSGESNTDANLQAEIERLQNENDKLRGATGLTNDSIIAEVIQKDVSGFQRTLIVRSQNMDQAIEGGAVVSNGFLVGAITRITGETAVVQLITDPGFSTTASVSEGSSGVIKTEEASLVFDLTPDADLTDQQIVTDGLDKKLPPGIPVGLIGERLSNGEQAFHTYHLVLPDSLTQLQFVSIDTGSTQ